MKSPGFAAAFVIALVTSALSSPAALVQTKMEVPWSGLAEVLEGRVVETVAPDGTTLRGRILNVSESDLLFQVKKTSNAAAYPKGEAALLKGQVKVFSYSHRKSSRGRAIGAAVGTAAGAVPAMVIGGIAGNEGADATGAVLGLVGVGAALGYGIGYAADKKTVTVVVADGIE